MHTPEKVNPSIVKVMRLKNGIHFTNSSMNGSSQTISVCINIPFNLHIWANQMVG